MPLAARQTDTILSADEFEIDSPMNNKYDEARSVSAIKQKLN